MTKELPSQPQTLPGAFLPGRGLGQDLGKQYRQ